MIAIVHEWGAKIYDNDSVETKKFAEGNDSFPQSIQNQNGMRNYRITHTYNIVYLLLTLVFQYSIHIFRNGIEKYEWPPTIRFLI